MRAATAHRMEQAGAPALAPPSPFGTPVTFGGSMGVFFSNGLVSTIMALGFIALFWSVISAGISKIRGVKPATAG